MAHLLQYHPILRQLGFGLETRMYATFTKQLHREQVGSTVTDLHSNLSNIYRYVEEIQKSLYKDNEIQSRVTYNSARDIAP